jgi:hypothetical protein
MVIRIRYTKAGTRYADYSKATASEELELYRRMQPKEGSVVYRPQPRSLRSRAADQAASSASSPAAEGQAGQPSGKGQS